MPQFSHKSLSFHNYIAIRRSLTPKTAWINFHLSSESWCLSVRTHTLLNLGISVIFRTGKFLLFINTPRFAVKVTVTPSLEICLFGLGLCFSVIWFSNLDVGYLGWIGLHPYLGLFLHRGKMVFSFWPHSSFFLSKTLNQNEYDKNKIPKDNFFYLQRKTSLIFPKLCSVAMLINDTVFFE